jgi:ubiquinone biosynthesis protein Coq4
MAKLPDAQTAARYRGLAELPEGTLGRTFFEHCRGNGFALPGERGALPETMVFHDMAHALVGAGTDIPGEAHMGGFEAGCLRERGFTMIEFALLLFNLGAKLPTDAAPAVGAVDIDVLLRGYADGRRATLDLLGWEPWSDVGESLSVLRERYQITAMNRDITRNG